MCKDMREVRLDVVDNEDVQFNLFTSLDEVSPISCYGEYGAGPTEPE